MSDRAQSSEALQKQREHDLNIFILHKSPDLAAGFHCNDHVNKMRTEGCQMLSTAIHTLLSAHSMLRTTFAGVCLQDCTKPAFPAHPCTRWVMESVHNYCWLWRLCQALTREHEFRFSNNDLQSKRRLNGSLHHPPMLFPDQSKDRNRTLDIRTIKPGFGTTPAQAIATDCKHDDPVTAYRRYYIRHKSHLHRWTPMSPPAWLTDPQYT